MEKGGGCVYLKQKDKIGEALQILNGVRELCIILEEGKDIPQSVYVVLQAAIERAVDILMDAAALDEK